MIRAIRTLTVAGVAGYTAILLGCSFSAPDVLETPADLYKVLNTAPYASPTSAGRWTVADGTSPQGLRVDHGFSCVEASHAADKTHLGIRVLEVADIPENYDATVFLNGWDAHYKSDDHHVKGVGAVVFNIRSFDRQLVWDAGGVLSDKNGDDGFRWCYDYTILYWPLTSKFDIQATHSDPTGKLLFVQDATQASVVHTIPGSFTSTSSKLPRAALPSGFAMGWNSGDHHVAQLGFALGEQSLSDKTLSWTSTSVLKDNAKGRRYRAAEAVTVLSGRGITVTRPDEVLVIENDAYVTRPNGFSLTPLPKTKCPRVQLGGTPTTVRNYAITGLTTDYAVPMLTGFELAFSCSDHHVRNVGAKIIDFSYTPPFNGQTGTLSYQVETMLTDKDTIPVMRDRVEVSVLGIDRLG